MLNHFLAGPILRRTTQNRICVWLALDVSLDLSLEILDKSENLVGASKPEQLTASRFQLGKNLYVYLLRAYPTNDKLFATDVDLYYRLLDEQIKDKSEEEKSEEAKRYLAAVTYEGCPYPRFHIPSKLASVLHGSCRKPHGVKLSSQPTQWQSFKDKIFPPLPAPEKQAQGIDTLSLGDDLLDDYYQGKADTRPDVLLLTGDQIYADDVSAVLLNVLREKAGELIGSECLPLREYDDTGEDTRKCLKLKLRAEIRRQLKGFYKLIGQVIEPAPEGSWLNPATIPLGGRMSLLKACNAGFSSTEAQNHLMSFGEFAAMYIYVFGNVNRWSIPTWQGIQSLHVAVNEKTERKIIAYAEGVEIFSENLWKVRRLLANIPTYMIFDDHDVTDDWNITGHWYDKVRSSPLGRRVVSNALAAYWAFQGWGNDPDNFDVDMIESIIQHLNSPNVNADIDERYDLYTWKHRGWGFSVPTNPPIIAMDSRTQRQSDNSFYPARLMDRYALDWLRTEWTKLKTSETIASDGNKYSITEETCPLIIATTPVLGFSPVEAIMQFSLWAIGYVEDLPAVRFTEELLGEAGYLTGKIVNLLDAEAWTANLTGFTDLLDTLRHKLNLRRCAFLSGDVHYAFTSVGYYKSSSTYSCEQKVLDCRQLNSSALRNEPSRLQKRALDKMARLEKGKTKKGNWWRFYASQWRLEHTLLNSSLPKGKRVVEATNLGQIILEQGEPRQHKLWIAPGFCAEYSIPAFQQGNSSPSLINDDENPLSDQQ